MMQILFIGCFILIGYVYPFLVTFRGGKGEQMIVRTWVWISVYLFFICVCFRPLLESYYPDANTDLTWVPEAKSFVLSLFMGWTLPLVIGAIGNLLRRLSMKLFPNWMNRISIHRSPHNPDFVK